MPEAGGPTTQSGILYQNSIAALYLGRLLDLRPVSTGQRIKSVRLEAPEQIDDIIIDYTNGSRLLIQAKESLSISSGPWRKFWADLNAQLRAPDSRLDQYRLILGTFSDDVENLREACDRSQGKEHFAEWLAALNSGQKRLIDHVAAALACPVEDVFSHIRRLTVEFLPRAHIESIGIRDWIPNSSTGQQTLFAILRDACGGGGRIRATFTASQLATRLFDSHKIQIFGAPGDGLENYLRSIGAEFDAIMVPGTPLSSSENHLLVWPNVSSISRAHHTDFEDEIPFRFHVKTEEAIELKNFPHDVTSRVFLVAGAGFGKSTFLRAIARRLASSTSYVPAYISADVLQSYRSIDQYLTTTANQYYRANIDWTTLCEQGRAVLLIDGLDELSDEGRSTVATMINQADVLYPAVPILVAARDSAAISLPASFQYCRLERLDDEQLSDLLKRYLAIRKGVDDSTLISNVIRKAELVALCRIPLFAAMLVATLPPAGNVPDSRADLLERYLDVVLSPHRHKKTGRPQLPLSSLRKGAEVLARLALDSNEIAIRETTAREHLNLEFGGIRGDQCVEELLRCGLTVRRGFRIGFAIATVQEYLAACDLVKTGQPDVEMWFRSVARRPWAQAVQFALETTDSVENLLSIQLAKQDDYYRTTLRLIARSIVNGARVSQDFRNQVATKLTSSWLSSTYEVCKSIGRLIADGFAKPASNELIELLKTEAASRYGGIDILEQIGDDDLIFERFKRILGEKDIRDLWHSIWLRVAKTRPSEAVSLLLDCSSRRTGDSLSVSVIADLLYRLRDCQVVDWADIARNVSYPSAIRAAAHFGAGTENTKQGRIAILENARSAGDSRAWDSFSEALFSTTWWREHVRDILTQAPINEGTLNEFYCYLSIDPKKPAAQDFLRELKELVLSGVVPHENQMRPLLVLAANEDKEAGAWATEHLTKASDDDVFEWLRICPFLDDTTHASGIRSIRARAGRKNLELELLDHVNRTIMFTPAGPQHELCGMGPFRTTSHHTTARQAAATWTLDALERLKLTHAERAKLLVDAVENDYGVNSRQLLAMLRDYLATAPVIDRKNWNWVAGAVDALTARNRPIDIDILWAIFDKGNDLPTWWVLELIWADQGISCCDRLRQIFANRKEKRGEILGLLEKVAPLQGLSVHVSKTELRIEGLDTLKT
jgi:NACHT domain